MYMAFWSAIRKEISGALTSGVRVAYETRKFLHVNGTVAVGVVSLTHTHAHTHTHTHTHTQIFAVLNITQV